MLPQITEDFDLPQATEWLINVTKMAGLPGVKPKKHPTSPVVSVNQNFKASQTLDSKYKKYKIMFDALVAKFELMGGWQSLPRNYEGQYIFVSANNLFSVILSHVVGDGAHPVEVFEIEIRNLKPAKAQ